MPEACCPRVASEEHVRLETEFSDVLVAAVGEGRKTFSSGGVAWSWECDTLKLDFEEELGVELVRYVR